MIKFPTLMVELETIAILGIDSLSVSVQVEIVKTIPSFVIVGMVSRAINESKERIRAAFNSSAISFPNGKIIVNLAPADIVKEGSHYDLPIAVGILAAMGKIHINLENTIIFGELALNGDIVKTKDLLPAALYCYKNNKKFLIPAKHYEEAKTIFQDKMNLIVICNSLKELFNVKDFQPIITDKLHSNTMESSIMAKPVDVYHHIVGNYLGKRCCALSMAGRHNIMLFGPPGSGKSLLCRSMKNFNLQLCREDSLVVSAIHSSAGLLHEGKLVSTEPFRSPHHSISYAALIGGGSAFRPGEISLSHSGILFLDEVAEFNPQTLDNLRQVMEDKRIVIARANYNVTLPADFQLICTMNPCKCGFYGDYKRKCICGIALAQKYQRRISGPFLDRIDMKVLINNNEYTLSEKTPSGEYLYNRVISARKMQEERYGALNSNIRYNSLIKEEHIPNLNIVEGGVDLVQKFISHNMLSYRKFIKIIALSRTIADFEQQSQVSTEHITEAIFLNCKMNY